MKESHTVWRRKKKEEIKKQTNKKKDKKIKKNKDKNWMLKCNVPKLVNL